MNKTLLSLILLGSFIVAGSPILANDPHVDLAPAIGALAKEIHAYMKGKDQEIAPVSVGEFKYVKSENGVDAQNVTTEAGFKKMLQDELANLKHASEEGASFTISGTYTTTEVLHKGVKCIGLAVNTEITDGIGKRSKFTFTEEVFGEVAIMTAFGITASVDPKNSRVQNDKAIRKALIDPKFFEADNAVFSSESSPFGMEILVKGKSAPVTSDKGQATITIRRNDAYEVKLINKAPFEVAADVSIDGINMFAFSNVLDEATKKPRYSRIIVPAAKVDQPGSVIVPGWHRSDEERGYDQFLVTEYAKSAAGKLNKTTDLGTIQVKWQACWDPTQPFPEALVKTEPGNHRVDLGDATGFGQPTGGRTQAVERELGVVRDSVSIRYRTRAN